MPAKTTSAKKVSAPVAPKTSTQPLTMEDLLKQSQHELRVPQRGDVLEGIVTEITKKAVLVDIGAKTEGVIAEKEYEMAKDYISGLNLGDKVQVYVSSVENDRGQVILSLRKALANKKWEEFERAMAADEIVTVKGIELNRGGMIVGNEGLRGFVPTSQFGKEWIGKLESLLGTDLRVKVIEVQKDKNRLIFSERHVSEAQMIAKKAAVLDEIKVGEAYDGVVSGVMPFGAFVTVTVPIAGEKEAKGTIEGLVHISEISWEKVEDPKRYMKQGDNVRVKVLSLDKETGKLNLSIKQMSDDPWLQVADLFPEGTSVQGVVSRLAPFGVFVNLRPGIDGLIHISKLPVGQEPKIGEKIEVTVEKVEAESKRIRLGVLLTEVPVGYK
ncbi:MAG: 30S ribosomal protein S1 [Microgenomates group bacterium GW2011_GWF2_45_18]|nr:MAG: 30S ribosomal protein S1 [Microgenomates group bacterium GW2011_GWF1_44_10]KKU01674.1 MAG: 30S ribosomal protein S1 [Microgenomates group bacterium GW2011_GWF2_45_18]OGJ40053.1 MAG: hypothetical protein A2378_01080 [Candidatus Pacebacteria bacterium RIFOXYB1_FULL_44_10]